MLHQLNMKVDAHLTWSGPCEESSWGSTASLSDASVTQPINKLFTQESHMICRKNCVKTSPSHEHNLIKQRMLIYMHAVWSLTSCLRYLNFQFYLCLKFAGIFALRSACYLQWGTQGCVWGYCWGGAGCVWASELAPLIVGFRDCEAAERRETTDQRWIQPVGVCSLQEMGFRSWVQNWKQNKLLYVFICYCVLSPWIVYTSLYFHCNQTIFF